MPTGTEPPRDPFRPCLGGVLSADIAVPEHEREARFYARVLTTGERPLWREDLTNRRGRPVIGLGARSAAYADLPLQWMPHIQVADVAASVGRARDLGGTEILHGRDDEGRSQWAVLLDPDGAAFGVVPVGSAEAVPPEAGALPHDAAAGEGCITRIDLTVADAPATCDFYYRVVGWSVQDVDGEGAGGHAAPYTMLGEDGSPVAGVRQAGGDGPDLPAVWMLALPVGDLAESLRRVREGGGTVLEASRGTDGAYSYATVQDPVGACLALVPG